MKTLDVIEVKKRILNEKIVLLDVREKYELEIAKVKNCIHIPMMEIPKRFNELNISDDIAVICHSGVRSAQVCSFLESKGFSVFNVAGGIDMWSVKIDSNIQRY